jgi:GNAT superfamily N-acetyltransferase
VNESREPTSIRDATPQDYGTFARLFVELHAPEPAPGARVYEERLVQRAFIGVESGAPTAFACWRPDESVTLHVSMIAVLPERRRRGLGRQMMLEAARRGRTGGFTRWQLNVAVENVPAQALYERLGMVIRRENVLLEVDAALALRLSEMTWGSPNVHILGRFGEPPPEVRIDGPPVRVVVEGDVGLASELRVAGGVEIHRTFRMSGEIPEAP